MNILCFLCAILIASLLPSSLQAQADNALAQSRVKKIIMMMNIVSKEYREGIADGKIINAAEYEESQVFLEQAFDRLQSVQDQSKTREGIQKITSEYQQLSTDIQSKVDPEKIKTTIDYIANCQLPFVSPVRSFATTFISRPSTSLIR